jgi:hypothetical protein
VTDTSGTGSPRTFRSPFAVAVWWLWVLFAAANLIDLAVQGRDHFSVVVAFALLLITGVVYATAQRPRVVADGDGLTIVNPLRDHRVGWAAVAGIDRGDLLCVRCEWPLGGHGEGGTAQRVIYVWAVQTPRRRQAAARLRAQSRPGGGGPFGSPAPAGAAGEPPVVPDSERVAAELTALAERAHAAAAGGPASPPVSAWHWPAFAAVVVPALALLVAVLVLRRQLAGGGRRVGRP